MLTLLGFANPVGPIFDQLVKAMLFGIEAINHVVGNYGWSLILVAVIVKVVFWPLNAASFKSMGKMQSLQPKIKALQKKYPGKDQETVAKLNGEMMALYKEQGVNPLAGCIPALLPLPVIIAVYYAIQQEAAKFADAGWLWIGTEFSHTFSHIVATSLAKPDYVLLVVYIISMYFSVRYASPATSPEQEQQQKIMAFISPAMIGYFGFQYHWPSGLLIYWIAFNFLTMGQQFYFLRQRAVAATEIPAVRDVPLSKNGDGATSPALSKTQQKKRRARR